METELSLEQRLRNLPPAWPEKLLPGIAAAVARHSTKVVILDDDPTGTQTVYDIPVRTTWEIDALREALRDDQFPGFFVLTNSRSMTADAAARLNREVARNLVAASSLAGVSIEVISRSDSTLRGHFPLEVDVLRTELRGGADACLFIPFFEEGGRLTIDDVHFVLEGDRLVPVAHTPFAQDKVFGYQSSNLRAWIEEKTEGRVHADAVHSVSLADIRSGGTARVLEQLMRLKAGAFCVVNAISMADLHVVVSAILQAKAAGRNYLYRTAASFVQARLGLSPRPLLAAHDVAPSAEGGGLIVVGSYVPRTTAQLAHLLDVCDVTHIELPVTELVDDSSGVLSRLVPQVNAALTAGADVVVSTSRALVYADDATANLDIGRRVSNALVAVVRAVNTRPRYILAKGGITSSDVLTAGLGVKAAMIQGQLLPGVPVWKTGAESRFPGLSCVVFPGNVGAPDALGRAVIGLAHKE